MIDTSPDRDAHQIAYRIIVASSPSLLKRGKGDLWDSGKVMSDSTAQIEYAGKPLQSRQHAYWKVAVWNVYSMQSSFSQPAQWKWGFSTSPTGRVSGLASKNQILVR